MSDLAERIAALSDQEIDALAGEAVGIEPNRWEVEFMDGASVYPSLSMATHQIQRGVSVDIDAPPEPRPIYGRFSSDPAASAKLCKAALKMEGKNAHLNEISIFLTRCGAAVTIHLAGAAAGPVSAGTPGRATAEAVALWGVESGLVELPRESS